MEWVETTAPTVEEATSTALSMLGIAPEDAEVEVLAEAKMGLFGRLREQARVRARVRPAIPRAKDDTRRRGPRPGATDDASPRREAEDAGRRGPGRGDRGGAERTKRAPAREGDGTMEAREERRPEGDVSVDDQAAIGSEILTGLLDAFGLAGSVETRTIDEETRELAVTGDDLGLLVGPKGATLTAVQELVRTAVLRKTDTHHGRLLVDVAGYRQKRKVALEKFTRQVADDVLASGTAAALEPMGAPDRKVIHDTVNDIDGVVTTSEGEEPNRRVVVRPA